MTDMYWSFPEKAYSSNSYTFLYNEKNVHTIRPRTREEMELQLKYIDFLNEEIAKREMIELKKIQKELDDENEDKENQEVLQLIQMRRVNSTNFAELTC